MTSSPCSTRPASGARSCWWRSGSGWAAFRGLALTDDEIARIADNLAPYLR